MARRRRSISGGIWSGVSSRRKFLRWRFGFGSGCGLRLGAKGSETFECENLLAEDLAELAGRTVRDGFETGQCCRIRNFPFEACDGAVSDAAGIDERESAEVGGDVEGKAMRRNAARNMNADGSDFALSLRRVLRGCRTTLIQKGCPTAGGTRRR